ncbi:MAG TPA: DUF4952 domain-containing protein [Dyella sp.]
MARSFILNSLACLLLLLSSTTTHAAGFALSCIYIGHPPGLELLGPRKQCARQIDGQVEIAPDMFKRLTYGKYRLGQIMVLNDHAAWRYVKKTGQMLAVITFDNGADYFSEGLTRGIIGGKIAYFDADFRQVLGPFDDGTPFRNGRAAVCLGCDRATSGNDGPRAGRWGFIDRTGKQVIPIDRTPEQIASMPWPDETPRCGDFLGRYGMKPGHLEFTGCEEGKDAQLRALIAHYRVKGADAASVETLLRRDTGMNALRYLCCGWQVVPGKDAATGDGTLPIEADSKVSMGSGETVVHDRKSWPQIPWFTVNVVVDIETP